MSIAIGGALQRRHYSGSIAGGDRVRRAFQYTLPAPEAPEMALRPRGLSAPRAALAPLGPLARPRA